MIMVKCPRDGATYRRVRTVFRHRGVTAREANALRCPRCDDEVFTIGQAAALCARLHARGPSASLEQKIGSSAGRRPVLYLPQDALRAVGLKIGDAVRIGFEGNKKRLVITPA